MNKEAAPIVPYGELSGASRPMPNAGCEATAVSLSS